MASNNTILIKRSSVPGKVPTVENLNLGELAINTNDGRLFTKRSFTNSSSQIEERIVEFTTNVAIGNALYVSANGSDESDGETWDSAFATLEKAAEVAGTNNSVPTLIDVGPGTYHTDGLIDIPDNTIVRCPTGGAIIRPNSGQQVRNVFCVGSGCIIEGFTFADWTHDNLVAPNFGFAVVFRQNAIIAIDPIVYRINIVRSTEWGDVAPPLDIDNSNPLVGIGGGAVFADGSKPSSLSIDPTIICSNIHILNENGVGLCASNGARISASVVGSSLSHKHFVAVTGGSIVIDSSVSTYGDYSFVAESSRQIVEPIPFAASSVTINTSNGNTILQQQVQIVTNVLQSISSQITTWPAASQQKITSLLNDLVRTVGWTFVTGNTTPFNDLPLLLYSATGQFIEPTRRTTYANAFEQARLQIVSLSLTTATVTAVNQMFAVLNTNTVNPIFTTQFSTIIATNHTWRGVLLGVAVTRDPIFPPGNSIQDSILELDGGIVTVSGQDDFGTAVLVSGITIDANAGEITGAPFAQSAGRIATRAAIVGSF